VNKIEEYKKLVDSAISLADKETSKVANLNVLQVYGLTSSRIKHLIHNLVDNPNTNYLEVGVYRGSTIIVAAVSRCNSCIGIDNFSYNPYSAETWKQEGWNNVRNAMHDCIEKYRVQHKVKIIEQDVLTNINKYNNFIDTKQDVIFFDIDTFSPEQIENTLGNVLTVGNDTFILLMSNINKDKTVVALKNVLAKENITIDHEVLVRSSGRGNDNNWWNGVGVYVLSKPVVPEEPKVAVKTPVAKTPPTKKV